MPPFGASGSTYSKAENPSAYFRSPKVESPWLSTSSATAPPGRSAQAAPAAADRTTARRLSRRPRTGASVSGTGIMTSPGCAHLGGPGRVIPPDVREAAGERLRRQGLGAGETVPAQRPYRRRAPHRHDIG